MPGVDMPRKSAFLGHPMKKGSRKKEPKSENRELLERLQEKLEARRLSQAWDEGRITSSLKGM